MNDKKLLRNALSPEARLTRELEKLQDLLNHSHDLRVVWAPRHDSKTEGEVIGQVIYVYSKSLGEALKTLRHEFLDLMISNTIEPYKQVTNCLIASVNKEAYARKERLVEKLVHLLS